MATRTQRKLKLARARFHSAQCKERNRSGRSFVRTYDEPARERRSAVMTIDHENAGKTVVVNTDLNAMTRDALRAMAATLNIRGRSAMTKDALIKAIAAHS